ncbi:MAG: hypothetical protein LCH70_05715 [Proteobacteria bacterium]|nr:hypothetical protein [Pseudomonadota bacterium]
MSEKQKDDDLPFNRERFSSKKDADARAEKIRQFTGESPSVHEIEGKWIVSVYRSDEDDYSDLDEAESRRADYRRDSGTPADSTVVRNDHPTKGVYGD